MTKSKKTGTSSTPPRRFVGTPGQRHGGQWAMYGYETTESDHIGHRSREWTAAGQTEVECLFEMAECLGDFGR